MNKSYPIIYINKENVFDKEAEYAFVKFMKLNND